MHYSIVFLSRILAEAHKHGHVGTGHWMALIGALALILVMAGVVLTVLVLLLRGKLPPEDETLRPPSGGKPPESSISDTTVPEAHPGDINFAEDPEQAWQRYLDCEDEIVAILKQRGRHVAQSELCQYLGLTADEMARALGRLVAKGISLSHLESTAPGFHSKPAGRLR